MKRSTSSFSLLSGCTLFGVHSFQAGTARRTEQRGVLQNTAFSTYKRVSAVLGSWDDSTRVTRTRTTRSVTNTRTARRGYANGIFFLRNNVNNVLYPVSLLQVYHTCSPCHRKEQKIKNLLHMKKCPTRGPFFILGPGGVFSVRVLRFDL